MLLFAGSWTAQFFTQLADYISTQQSHGQPATWSGYWPQFLASTFENWQSEWLQLIFQAILLLGAKHWIFRVDAEDMERIEAKIDDIADRLAPSAPTTESLNSQPASGLSRTGVAASRPTGSA